MNDLRRCHRSALRHSLQFHGRLHLMNGNPDLKFLKELKSVINEFQPDVIHCFDDKVYLVTTYALTLLTKRIPIVLNKCGGPNMPDYPIAQHLVMFSEENLQYYQANKVKIQSQVSDLPNAPDYEEKHC